MWIKRLKLNNFRNYKNIDINFSKGINLIYGENAQGKTNIIESIYLCAIGKSFRTNKDVELINLNEKNALVEVEFVKEDREGKVKIAFDGKKNIFLNGIKIKRLSELVSNLNIVVFSPDDIGILKGDPDNRRRFLNMLIGQLKPNYLFLLKNYSKVLEQRNSFLKQIRDEGKSEDFLDIWDEKLADFAFKIYLYRKEFVEKISKELIRAHSEITGNKEKISIEFISDCGDKNKILELLKKRRKFDIFRGFSSKGAHRDDFLVSINDKPVKNFGSQGQNRTAVLSLKLAELAVVKAELEEFPVLLLDDFMSELDRGRINNFLEKIEDIQVFITCTEKFVLEKKDFFVYNVVDGKIYEKN